MILGDDLYSTTLQATSAGSFDLIINQIGVNSGNDGIDVFFDDISIQNNSIGTIEVGNEVQEYTLYMDYDGNGTVDDTIPPTSEISINEDIIDTPIHYMINQNYPNPFNPITTITFQLPEAAMVNVSIYNISGQLVETLVNERKNTGYHSVVWDASGIGSGVYFYKITTGEYLATGNCLLLR